MAASPRNVRSWVRSGKHLLGAIISGFDPERLTAQGSVL
jgi:hypothetical protein